MDNIVLFLPIGVFLSVVLLILGVHGLLNEKRLLARGRLEGYLQEIPTGPTATSTLTAMPVNILREESMSSIPTFHDLLKGSTIAQGMSQDLAQANIRLRVGEYLILRGFLTVLLLLAGLLINGNIVIAVVFAAAGSYAPKLYVNRRRGQRVKAFNDQLVDALGLMSNSLKSGFGFLQAMEQVSNELAAPLSEEFRRVLVEVSMGATAENALTNLNERVRSYDLELAVTVMLIQRKVGGNLAEILENIAHTIRERVKIHGEVQTLTTEARLSGLVLGALPIGLMLILYMVQPAYVTPLFTTPIGQIMLVGAGVMEIAGFFLIRKIATIEV